MAKITNEKKINEGKCCHPPNRLYSWFAYNCYTGKNDLQVACCDCGKVLSPSWEEVTKKYRK